MRMIRLKTIILFVLSAAAVLLPPAGLLAFAGEVGRQKDSLLTLLPALEGEAKLDRKSTRLNSSHKVQSRMPSSA